MDSSLLASIRNFKKSDLAEAETVDKSGPVGVVSQADVAVSSPSPSASASASPSPSNARSAAKSKSKKPTHTRVTSTDSSHSLFGGSNAGSNVGSGYGSAAEQDDDGDDDAGEFLQPVADTRKPAISRSQSTNSSLFTDISDEITREVMIGFVDQLNSGKPVSVIMMVMKSRLPDERLHERVLAAAGVSNHKSSVSSLSVSRPTSPTLSIGSASPTSPKSKRSGSKKPKKSKSRDKNRNRNLDNVDEHEMTSTRRPTSTPSSPERDRISDITAIVGTKRQIKRAENKSYIPPPLIHTPIKAGWVNKQSRYLKQWRCRWFVLQGDTLYTFKSQHVLEKPTEAISLKTYNTLTPITDISQPINAMELSSAEQPKLRTFVIDPLNEPNKCEWTRVLEKAIAKAARG